MPFRKLTAADLPDGIPTFVTYPTIGEIRAAGTTSVFELAQKAIGYAKIYCPVLTGRLRESIRVGRVNKTTGRFQLIAGGIVVRGQAVYYARDVHDGLNLHANRGPRPFLRQGIAKALTDSTRTVRTHTIIQRTAPFGISRDISGLQTFVGETSLSNPLTGNVSYRDPSTGRFVSRARYGQILKRHFT